MQNIVYLKAKEIKLLICDIDGVLTDGGLYFDQDGNEFKRFCSQDGHGLKALMQYGIEVATISARNTPAVTHRMKNLGIKHYYQAQNDKAIVLDKLLGKLQINVNEVAYVGDDVVDLVVMRQVGLAIAVNNAVAGVKKYAHWITQKNGGQGAVREVCDFLLEAQGFAQDFLEQYLK